MYTGDGDRAIRQGTEMGVGEENTFAGVLSFFRRQYSKNVEGADIVVAGAPFDQAVTNRPGTRFGPRAIRAASTSLAWSGGAWPWEIDPFETLKVLDYGDFGHDLGRPADFPETLRKNARGIIDQGVSLLTLGGDHFILYPLLKAHAEVHGPVALVQFDAHSDTWDDDDWRVDHGTMLYHAVREGLVDVAHSVQVGIRTSNPSTLGITTVDADWVHENGPARTAARIAETVGEAKAYLSFDIDCLDPAFAPGTGTPVCGGLSTWQARKILHGLVGLDFIAMDLVEVSPAYDHSDITALAAATVALDYLAIRAVRKAAVS